MTYFTSFFESDILSISLGLQEIALGDIEITSVW